MKTQYSDTPCGKPLRLELLNLCEREKAIKIMVLVRIGAVILLLFGSIVELALAIVVMGGFTGNRRIFKDIPAELMQQREFLILIWVMAVITIVFGAFLVKGWIALFA